MPEKPKIKIENMRIWILLAIILVAGFGSLIFQLFQIQIKDGEKYKGMALQQRTSLDVLTAKRGSIYDRNQKVLAHNAIVWNVCISPAEIDEEIFPKVVEDLARIMDIEEDIIFKASQTLTAEGKKSYYAVFKYQIEAQEKEEIETYLKSYKKKINWIYIKETTKRYYIYDNLASSILGFTDNDQAGAYGIESYYNKILSGTPGVEVSTKNARGYNMDFDSGQMYEAKDGDSLVLTLDETVQSVLEKNLEMAVIEHGIEKSATGIVLNIKTGEVLGMASKPDFNPNKPRELSEKVETNLPELLKEYQSGEKIWKKDKETNEVIIPSLEDLRMEALYDQWRNKAVSDPYEPGSVHKIVTAAIALEDRLTYNDDQFYCSGTMDVSGEPINCWELNGHGQQNLIDIMRNSCNPGFTVLGLRSGPERVQAGLTNFGYGQPTGIDLYGEAEGILHSYSVLSGAGKIELANTSFGQSIKATPIQVASAIGAALNGGELMQPFVVKQIIDSEGNVVDTTQPYIKRQVVSKETSDNLATLVEAVVTNGSGRNAKVPGYRIGGKTGTSQKLDIKEKKYVLSFAGFAPMEDPTYVVLVLLDEPKVANPQGSVIAAPVVGAILQEILPYLGVEPQFTAEELAMRETTVPNVVNAKPHDAQAEITAAGLRTKIVGSGTHVLRQIPQGSVKAKEGTVVTIYTDEASLKNDIKIPDIVGLSPDEAKEKLLELGLNIEYRGSTNGSSARVVSEQWPQPTSGAVTGDVVVATFVVKKGEGEDSSAASIIPDGEVVSNLEDFDPESSEITGESDTTESSDVSEVIPEVSESTVTDTQSKTESSKESEKPKEESSQSSRYQDDDDDDKIDT